MSALLSTEQSKQQQQLQSEAVHPLQQQQQNNDEPPRRPSNNSLGGGDVVAVSNTVVNSVRRLFMDDARFIDTTSEEGAEVVKKNSRQHPKRSSSNGIVVINRPVDTITPIKKKNQQESTAIITPTSTPETHKISVSTISSNASSITDASDLSTIVKAYRLYKSSTREHSSNSGKLQNMIDLVQFCGMYLCGGGVIIVNETSGEKEERTQEINNTFLGKMIRCGNIHDSCGNGDYAFDPCRNEERYDLR